jgi:hypothetical protein
MKRIAAAVPSALLFATGSASMSAQAQSSNDSTIGTQLGPGYAQMINLANSPDFTTARYHINTSPTRMHLDVTRLPLNSSRHVWSETTEVLTRLTAGYLRLSTELPTSLIPGGRVDTHWTAVGLSGGVAARIGLSQTYTFVPALDVGVSRLENHATFLGPAVALQPVFEGSVFNWHSHAWQVSPSVGVDWLSETIERRLEVRTHLSWSRVASLGESDPALQFRRSVGAVSIRFDRTSPASWTLFDRPPSWVILGGHTAFLGPSRNALGFSWVSELGGGLEWPSRASAGSNPRIRATLSVLVGDHVRGARAGIGVEF